MKRRVLTAASLAAMLLIMTCALCGCSDWIGCKMTVGGISPPVLSHQTGVYDSGFTLTASSSGNTTIRYTLDGSEPTADSTIFPADGLTVSDRSGEPNLLSGISASKFTTESNHIPPKVSKATVVRAAAFNSSGECSETVTATFFVGLDYSDIKIVSLVLDSSSLFDYETGIYILGKAYDDWVKNDPENAAKAESWQLEGNFSQKGRDWEREVLLQVIDENGSLGIEQSMGLRIMGAASRRYYQKSFRLTAREEYGAKRLEYPLISGLVTDSEGEPLEKYKSFLLRNGGNDNGYTFLRDAYIQSLVSDRDITTQGSEPCIVFINGEYWGLYTITEDYSDNYIQYNYGVDKENVVMVKTWELEEGNEEDMELFETINSAIYSKNFTVESSYKWLWTKLDMQSFIDYMAIQLYINNDDGVFEGNNWRVWRAREVDEENEYADGKWRFMLYDTDMSMGLYGDGSDFSENTLTRVLSCDWGWGLLLEKLLEVDDFREQFVNTFMDLRNTAFHYSNATEKLIRMKLAYEPYAVEQYRRNGPEWVLQWTDVDERFNSEINVIRKFVNGRYGYSLKMLAETLELGEYYELTLSANDAEGGEVVLNTVKPDLTDGEWKGTYFSDYSVTLTAEPTQDFEFTGWSGDIESSDPTITLQLEDNTSVIANFERK